MTTGESLGGPQCADAMIFVYGTLRDDLMRAAVLAGIDGDIQAEAAVLPDHLAFQAADGPYPVLRRAPGHSTDGLLLAGAGGAVRARLEAFEGAFGYVLSDVTVTTAQGPQAAQVFQPPQGIRDTGAPWDLAAWQAADRDTALAYVAEAALLGFGPMAGQGVPSGHLRRAIARSAAAADPGDQPPRTSFGPDGIRDLTVDRRYAGFFAYDLIRYRHALFGGGHGAPVTREVMSTGDAVTVLPWDPVTDRIVLIEQVRAGLIMRGDPNPWNLEVVAGLRDQAETPEQTARREAMEEAALTLGPLEQIAGYYPSPGVLTEHVTSFIGRADLSAFTPGIHGLESEAEDIRTLVVSFDAAMAAMDSGALRNAPLIVSLLGLARRHAALRAAWT